MFLFLLDIQPVEQLDLFGDMSTPPDIQAPNVSVVPQCQMFSLSGPRGGIILGQTSVTGYLYYYIKVMLIH